MQRLTRRHGATLLFAIAVSCAEESTPPSAATLKSTAEWEAHRTELIQLAQTSTPDAVIERVLELESSEASVAELVSLARELRVRSCGDAAVVLLEEARRRCPADSGAHSRIGKMIEQAMKEPFMGYGLIPRDEGAEIELLPDHVVPRSAPSGRRYWKFPDAELGPDPSELGG